MKTTARELRNRVKAARVKVADRLRLEAPLVARSVEEATRVGLLVEAPAKGQPGGVEHRIRVTVDTLYRLWVAVDQVLFYMKRGHQPYPDTLRQIDTIESDLNTLLSM